MSLQVHLRRGVVEALFVEDNEPASVTNIKKAIVSNLNMDLSGSKLNTNNMDLTNAKKSHFTVLEQSLHGDCQTTYKIKELSKVEAMELEDAMELPEVEMNHEEHHQSSMLLK